MARGGAGKQDSSFGEAYVKVAPTWGTQVTPATTENAYRAWTNMGFLSVLIRWI